MRRRLQLLTQLTIKLHDAGLRLLEGAAHVVGDVNGHAQEDLTLARVTGLRVGGAIRGDIGRQLGQGAQPHGSEDVVALRADARERIGAGRRHADGRMGPLIRLGHHTRIVELEMLAFKREGFLRPGATNDFERLGESLAAFGVWHAVVLVGSSKAAAADAEDQPAVADVVNRGGFFGQLQRVAQW